MGIDQDGFLSEDISIFVRNFTAQNKDVLDLTADLNRFALKIMLALEPHNKHVQELVAATLLIRCMSHYQATIILCRQGLVAEAKIVARSMMEAMFILGAISKEYRLAVEYAQEDEHDRLAAIRRYKEMHRDPPPGMTTEQLASWEAEVRRRIEVDRIPKRKTREWAEEAGLQYWYLSPYFHLSQAVHAKSRELTDHVETNAMNEVVQLNWGPSDSEARIVLGTVIEGLCIAVHNATAVFRMDVSGEMSEYRARLRGLSLEDKAN